jgi:PHD/YefM family antitoxin component YafN of YafNO toxin-antitoxin module
MPLLNPSLKERLEALLAELPSDKLALLVDFAEYLRDRKEWEATWELLSDPKMRKDVMEGRRQAEQGKGKPWREVQKRVSRQIDTKGRKGISSP